jgi:hypothetical protein
VFTDEKGERGLWQSSRLKKGCCCQSKSRKPEAGYEGHNIQNQPIYDPMSCHKLQMYERGGQGNEIGSATGSGEAQGCECRLNRLQNLVQVCSDDSGKVVPVNAA